MPLQYFFTPIVDGTSPSGEPMRRPKAAVIPAQIEGEPSWEAIYPIDPAKNFCLIWIRAEDLSAQNADTANDAMPPIDYAAPLSSVLNNSQYNNLVKKLQNRGVNTSTMTINSTALEVLILAADVLQPGYKNVRAKV